MESWMWYLELVGTIAFSISGAMEAMKKEMDLLGVIILGVVTAVGGGVLRDIIIGKFPPTAFQDSRMALAAILTAVLAFLYAHLQVKHPGIAHVQHWNEILFLSDSVGLAVFTIMGAKRVQDSLGTDSTALLLFVGVITGVGGGVLRDLLAGSVPYIMRKHVYATASIIGVIVYLLLGNILPRSAAAIIGMLTVYAVRLLASYFKWNLPRVKIGL